MKNENSADDNARGRKNVFASVPRALLLATVIITLFGLFTIVAPLVLSDQSYGVTWEQLREEGRDIRMLQITAACAVIVLIALIVSFIRKLSGKASPHH
uniref:Ycg4J n=1 Tax=Corynebacterium glutamicum TaxID=1718 RepID=Q9EUM4_CORGT|nr:Ycg4J [Corynebacterium glutamicum]